MGKNLVFLIPAVLLLFVSCSVKRSVQAEERRSCSAVGTLELRRLDSLWSSLSETATVHVEFFRPDVSAFRTDTAKADTVYPRKSGAASLSVQGQCGGTVKCVDITFTRETASLSTTDTGAVVKDSVCYEDERNAGKQTSAGCSRFPLVFIAAVAVAVLFFVNSKFMKK
ncbi:MAG: hypothetical protein Q4F69_02515 [Bacteroidia bacterium]|nr:hypothetical protein [Bacteroidia bacterium]